MKCNIQLCIFLCLIAAFASVTSLDKCHDTRLLSDKNVTGINVDQLSYRLPKEVVPTKYTLFIKKKVDAFSFSGYLTIRLEVRKPTGTIILHNDGLDVQSVNLNRMFGNNVLGPEPLNCYMNDTKRQFYIIKSVKTLEPSEYQLNIEYRGEIRDDVFGFYRSTYVENNRTKYLNCLILKFDHIEINDTGFTGKNFDRQRRWIAVTQFSPTYARRAFPCMDEPHFKAVFELGFHSSHHFVTSNTEINEPIDRGVYRFETTPPMSTYQLGWAMHEFVPESPRANADFRIWTRGTMHHRGFDSVNRGVLIDRALNDWIQIHNPISKVDQIALPDFNFHAMENWGMITYRESVVLFEDNATPMKYKFDGFTTMAHEYAHSWFGNLVTPMFWDVAWLKEGFASYFQYFALSLVMPSWEMMDKFVVDVQQEALLLDSTNHNRSMNDETDGSAASVMGMLDFVSYKKGASVIRMLSHVIGRSAFQNGLRSYLKYMSYQAATPSDLYKYLQKATDDLGHLHKNTSIQDIMETWTNQPGYPLVTVTRNYETQTVTVSQQRFSWNRDQLSSGWWIPLTFVKQGSPDFFNATPGYWLEPAGKNLTIGGILTLDDWVIFNIQQTGYYRVNYDEKNWQMITNDLNSIRFNRIHKTNRAVLIDDAFKLARAGYIDYSIPFNLCRYLVQERDYEPWVAAVNNFRFLNKMLSSTPNVQQAFQEYAVYLLRNMYEYLNFIDWAPGETTTELQRELIISTSCLLRNEDCLRTSQTLFGLWFTDSNKTISRNVRGTVYCEGVRNNESHGVISTIMDRWKSADMQIEQELLLQALGCSRNPVHIQTFLLLSMSDDKNVRKQQRMMIVNAALDGNPENVDYVLGFVQRNLQRIIELRGHDFLGKVITAIGSTMITEEQIEELRTFIQVNSDQFGSALDAAKKALSVASENAKWVAEYVPKIEKYFQ